MPYVYITLRVMNQYGFLFLHGFVEIKQLLENIIYRVADSCKIAYVLLVVSQNFEHLIYLKEH